MDGRCETSIDCRGRSERSGGPDRPAFESQENISVTGHCRNVGEYVEFTAERALNDFALSANPLRRAVYLMSAGRRLRRRLDTEARRRGQRVPRFGELGFKKTKR